jgi:hypothetical protein
MENDHLACLPDTPAASAAQASAPAQAVLVGLEGSGDPDVTRATLETIRQGLGASFPGLSLRLALVGVESVPAGWGDDVVALPPARRPGHLPPPAAASIVPGAYTGAQSPLPTLLEAAHASGVDACVLLAPEPHDDSVPWASLLVEAVVHKGMDLVNPVYARLRFDGAINTGLAAPLLRALFGVRLRQPLGGEVALSRRLVADLVKEMEWLQDPVRAGTDVWLLAKALAGGYRVCEALLGARPKVAPDPAQDLGQTLSRVLDLLFNAMDQHAATWQKLYRFSTAPTCGDAPVVLPDAHPVPVARMQEAFRLGCRDLVPLWSRVLSPATLVAMRRAARLPDDTLAVDDATWARAVYDFSLAYRATTLDRRQLLACFPPLYLGWLAGLVTSARDLDIAGVLERMDAVGRAFEAEKPYLTSRWRWPDRFSP